MSRLAAARERIRPGRMLNGPPPPPIPEPLPPGGTQAMAHGDLRVRRDQLARELAEAQFDLGGMAYEMAIRDHFRVDVLTRHAAHLQQLDSELGEVEHLLALDESGAAGACPSCGTLYARGSQFCSNCGQQLLERLPVGP